MRKPFGVEEFVKKVRLLNQAKARAQDPEFKYIWEMKIAEFEDDEIEASLTHLLPKSWERKDRLMTKGAVDRILKKGLPK